MIAFTICARNFLAQAQVLHASLARYHQGLSFYVAICDSMEGLDPHAFPFQLIRLDDLCIPRIDHMTNTYSITELNTSIKPFVFDFLFDRHEGKPIVYFDPNILIVSELHELQELLSDGADCVLTPHLLEPAEFSEIHDGKMLQFGVYNLGFCALRNTPQVARIVRWWGRRLEEQCTIDLSKALFVDQKWADLLPAFIEKTAILRHPGYNVAYWNLPQRVVQNLDGQWHVNNQPLRFFHFSGSVLTEPVIFSRHSKFFKAGGLRDLDQLFNFYVNAVRSQGLSYYRERYPYAFRWNGVSGSNEHTPSSVGSN